MRMVDDKYRKGHLPDVWELRKRRNARQAVTSFQMHAGIVADGIAGAQTEARLAKELNDLCLVEA
jgi:peptidoglycan hydrolase-like protein with peptidoglycan-binding domain